MNYDIVDVKTVETDDVFVKERKFTVKVAVHGYSKSEIKVNFDPAIRTLSLTFTPDNYKKSLLGYNSFKLSLNDMMADYGRGTHDIIKFNAEKWLLEDGVLIMKMSYFYHSSNDISCKWPDDK